MQALVLHQLIDKFIAFADTNVAITCKVQHWIVGRQGGGGNQPIDGLRALGCSYFVQTRTNGNVDALTLQLLGDRGNAAVITGYIMTGFFGNGRQRTNTHTTNSSEINAHVIGSIPFDLFRRSEGAPGRCKDRPPRWLPSSAQGAVERFD